nr:hypothetical protein [Saccharopolyspora pogona]
MQDPLRSASGQRDRLVRGEQRHVRPFQLPLDGQAFERAASDAGNALADHHIEPASGVGGFIEQVGDATITRDGDVEPLVVPAPAALVEFHPAGFDVVEVGDDHPRFGYCGLAVLQLPHQRLARVLLVLGRSAPKECHPDFVAQQRGGGHAEGGNGVVRETRWPGHRHRGGQLSASPRQRRCWRIDRAVIV